MKRILHLFSMLLLVLVSVQVKGQSIEISGTVTSNEDGSSLPGVNVVLKGTTKGVLTDADGKYSISAPTGGTLVFTYIGFKEQEAPIGGRSLINVILESDLQVLDEVIVTGFGSQIKRELTGNIARIKMSETADMPVTTFEQALQGKAAGVQINQGSGKLGQTMRISVRGQSSVSASNEPLYVIDGIPMTQNTGRRDVNAMADINPQDIESIEILKDASAGAIYGARAANGVVLITTKGGKSGRTNVNFGVQFGSSKPTKALKFLNTQQYIDFYRVAAGNADVLDGLDPSDPGSNTSYMEDFFVTQSVGTFGTANQADTDWGQLAFQDAPQQQYDLNINGGNEKTSFYISGQLLDQTGILIGNAFGRMSGRVNVNHKVSKRMNIGINMGLTRSLNERVSGDNSFGNPLQLVALPPMTPSTDPSTGLPVGTPPGDISIPMYFNSLIYIGNSYFNTTNHRNIGNVYGDYEIFKGLRFRTEFALDFLNSHVERYYNSKTQRNTGAPMGIADNSFRRVENYNTNNYFSYIKELGLHGVNATLGMSFQNAQDKFMYAEGQDFPSDAYKQIQSAARKTDASSTRSDYSFVSYFARVNYKWSDKYLLGLSGRMDGSSRFGANNRYGFFPAVSAGWVVSEEEFLKNAGAISFLKVRGSWGKTGNAEIGNFPQLGLYSGDAGYAGLPGQRPSQIGNPDLGWETTKQFDVGIDFGFLKNRINGEIDFYVKNTTGLLLNVNVPGTTGFESIVKNVGSLRNRGFEFVINSDNLIGDFKWRTAFNAAINRNEITNIDGQIIEGGVSSMSRAMEGHPIGTFYTVEYAGVDPANGDALWYKNTKNEDGTLDRTTTNRYNDAQRVVVGNALPKWTAGLNNSFSYKGFDLNVLFNGVFGNKLNFYGAGRYASANGRFEDNQTVNQLDAWTPENTITNVPQARLFYNNGAQASSRFIEDGSFIRLRNVTLGYNLPKKVLSNIKLNSVRVYVTGQNLLTFTKYSGWDPEVNSDDFSSNIGLGYDFYSTPQAKTILFGLNVGF
jgi:TonB-linked SusC/RagA family outer membrane protein